MSKTVFLGVEGSGKTSLTVALAQAFENHKKEGWYLKPLSRDSFRFLKTLPDILDGNFPSQTADLRELRWQAEYKGNDLGEIAILDYPGEIYRLAFLDEKDERDPEAFRQKVANNKPEIDALLGAIKEAEDVFVLFNLSDGMDLRDNPRNLDAVWVTNECLKVLKRLESKPRIRLLFTQVDRYRDAGLDLSTFSPKSIDLIGYGHGDIPWGLVSVVDPPESMYGIDNIIVQLFRAPVINNPVIAGSVLPNLEISNHEIQRVRMNVEGTNEIKVLFLFLLTGGIISLIIAIIHIFWLHHHRDHTTVSVSIGFLLITTSLLGLISRKVNAEDRVEQTRKLLHFFACGAWETAMHTKGVYDGDSYVLYYFGIAHLYGLGGACKDYSKAEKYFTQSAANGNKDAFVALGWMAENGLGMPKDLESSLRFYKEARARIT